jgi:hypothetical protein
MHRRTICTRTPDRYRLAASLSWKQAGVCALAMAFWTAPLHAQNSSSKTPPSLSGPITTKVKSVFPDAQPLPGPAIVNDEKCLPWNVSRTQTTTVSVKTLKVPSKAREEYQKACDASNAKKFQESEKHVRNAIEKFQNYPAAWVMLGVVLDDQHKVQEARDACSHAAIIDANYLPAYLCAAEFSARNQEWDQLLKLANAALALNSEGDGYAYYYQATAYLHLNNPVDARKSALQAEKIDVHHTYWPLYYLLAQIDDAQGDKVSAVTRLREVLKHLNDKEDQEAVNQYLARLETGETNTPDQKPAESSKSADADAPAGEPDDRTTASMVERRKPTESWVPEDIDQAVPPVASGVACSLPAVLHGAGQRIVELVQNVDRFTATETLIHRGVGHSGRMEPPITVKFNYLVSFAEDQSGYLQVSEFRNGSLSLEAFPTHIATVGTPSLVLIFHPRYINNFKMECEGLGEWEEKPAWQVRFEERTDSTHHMSVFNINGNRFYPRLRGRAWILADSFQVARVETDLEESIPKIRLRLNHESVEYRPVESSTNHLQLWLPSSTELYMDFQGHRFYRKHSFADFEIFSVNTEYKTGAPKQ